MVRSKAVVKYLGYILQFNAVFLFISAAISFAEGENSLNTLLASAVSSTVVGLIPHFLIGKTGGINFQEGLVISVLGWITVCITGMIPYYLWGGRIYIGQCSLRKRFGLYYHWSKHFRRRGSITQGATLLAFIHVVHWRDRNYPIRFTGAS